MQDPASGGGNERQPHTAFAIGRFLGDHLLNGLQDQLPVRAAPARGHFLQPAMEWGRDIQGCTG